MFDGHDSTEEHTNDASWIGPSCRHERWEEAFQCGDKFFLIPPESRATRTAVRSYYSRYYAHEPTPVEALQALFAIEGAINAEIALVLAELRGAGHTWPDIARELETSKQRLHKRFSTLVSRILAIFADGNVGDEQAMLLIEEIYRGWTGYRDI